MRTSRRSGKVLSQVMTVMRPMASMVRDMSVSSVSTGDNMTALALRIRLNMMRTPANCPRKAVTSALMESASRSTTRRRNWRQRTRNSKRQAIEHVQAGVHAWMRSAISRAIASVSCSTASWEKMASRVGSSMSERRFSMESSATSLL